MKSLVALVLLGQILGCISESPGIFSEQHPDCDSPEIEHAAAIAMDYINLNSHHGYKHVLNRIEKARVLLRRSVRRIIELELDLLETACHIVSPEPAANCTVRSREELAVEADCDVRLLYVNGDIRVTAAKCQSSADSAEEVVKLCPDCPRLLVLNDINVVNAANVALSKFNANSATAGYYHIFEISRGKHVPLPASVYVEFAITATNCSAQEAKDHVENCHVEAGEHAQFGFCKASVFQQPLIVDGAPSENVAVECAVYEPENVIEPHLKEKQFRKNVVSPGFHGTILDLIHFHNDTLASHESHSAEAVQLASPVVKRSVHQGKPPSVGLKKQVCPGKIRHFDI